MLWSVGKDHQDCEGAAAKSIIRSFIDSSNDLLDGGDLCKALHYGCRMIQVDTRQHWFKLIPSIQLLLEMRFQTLAAIILFSFTMITWQCGAILALKLVLTEIQFLYEYQNICQNSEMFQR